MLARRHRGHLVCWRQENRGAEDVLVASSSSPENLEAICRHGGSSERF